jgi:hypothetical protein
MQYFDGTEVQLGDVVGLSLPSGAQAARVVMLGDSHAHLALETTFLGWVSASRVLRPDSVVVEWLGSNPFAHDDPAFAPVGNYMFVAVDEYLVVVSRRGLTPIVHAR